MNTVERLAHAYLGGSIEAALTPGTSPGDHAKAGIRAVLQSLLPPSEGAVEAMMAALFTASSLEPGKPHFDVMFAAAITHLLEE